MKSDRLLGILLVLIEKKRVNASELARQFEVSTRTIYRDVESLGLAGVPIFSVPGVGGGISIMPGFKVERSVFSDEELSTLLVALNGLTSQENRAFAAVVRAKIHSLIPEGKEEAINARVNQVRIDASSWLGSRDVTEILSVVRGAIEKRALIQISYMSRLGDRTDRIVEPYRTIFKAGAWYLQGYCRKRSDFRLFKLSRIVDCTVMKECFLPRDCPEAMLDGLAVAESLSETVTLRVHKSILERMLDFVSFDEFELDDEEHYVVTVPFIDREYYYGMILSLGPRCEVVGPPHIRDRMREIVQSFGVMYRAVDEEACQKRG